MGSVSSAGVLFDSNILIDVLAGFAPAAELVAANPEGAVSVVTWIEVLAGPADGETAGRALLQHYRRLELTPAIVEQTILIRRARKALKLPDAIILATAREHGRTLLTRNTRDFSRTEPGVVIPYEF